MKGNKPRQQNSWRIFKEVVREGNISVLHEKKIIRAHDKNISCAPHMKEASASYIRKILAACIKKLPALPTASHFKQEFEGIQNATEKVPGGRECHTC